MKKKTKENETPLLDGRPAKAGEREKRKSGRHWRSFDLEDAEGAEGVEGDETTGEE